MRDGSELDVARERLHLLTVDDDDALVQMLALVYGGTHHLERAASVREATEKLLRGRFDAVILDVHLPDGLGIDLLRAVREEPRFAASRDIPVIMLTASSEGEVYEASWDLGSLAYVRKPFDVSELSQAVDRVIAERIVGRERPGA